jgi:hypothetical protein
MPTAAVIIPNASDAFAAYLAVADYCDVVVAPSLDRAQELSVPLDAIFLDARCLNAAGSAALFDRHGARSTRWIVLLSESTPAVDSSALPKADTEVVYGPLTTALVEQCLEGLFDPSLTPRTAQSANDENY